MPGTYDPESTYYMVSIRERFGEREYTTDVVVEARNIVEAKEKAERIALGWHEEAPIGDVLKAEVISVVPITPVEFFERAIMEPRT